MCKRGTTSQNEWYFFNHKDKKYPTGTRTNRATAAGFWKATGRDKVIYSSSKRIGLRKTLVFYHGRAPCGKKSNWIMYEYRFDDNSDIGCASKSAGESTPEDDGWVIYRIFKKKYRQADVLSLIISGTPKNETISNSNSNYENVLSYEQVQYLERGLVSDLLSCGDTSWEINKKDAYPMDISFSDGLLDEYFDLPVLESLNRFCALPEILDEN